MHLEQVKNRVSSVHKGLESLLVSTPLLLHTSYTTHLRLILTATHGRSHIGLIFLLFFKLSLAVFFVDAHQFQLIVVMFSVVQDCRFEIAECLQA